MKRLFATLAASLMLVTCVVTAVACEGGNSTGSGVDYTTVIPEGSFDILSPTANATSVSTTPAIEWSAEPNATSYHVEIATDETYTNVVRETTTMALSWTVSNALEHSQLYRLRITALKEDGTIALARKSTSFTTAAEHETETPDYTQSRTIYNFEEYTDTAALNERFVAHVNGDPIDITLSENGGVNGSKAMKIDYNAGSNGWSGALSSIPAEKKVWSGAKGIRMYIVGDASGVEVEVRFGKRGYQAWNATFNVNAVGGTYVSIPFSAFEDAGGGDGILDLSGITRLWFFFKGNRSATLYIDDITVGSNENYTVDTRSEIEKATIATIGTYGDFESYTDSAALNAEWVSENATVTLATTGAYGGSKAAAIVPSSGWATFGKDMPYTDFSNVVSITFKASAGLYVLQVISDYNVIETTIRANANGEVVGANLADLQPQSSAHTYKLDQINCVRIGIKDQSGSTVMIDDISLNDVEYVAVDHSAKVGTYDDFESYASATEMSAVWTTEGMSSVTLASTGAFGGSKAATLVPTAGWATFAISLPDMDFSAITSITFKASAGTYVVQMLSGWNVIEKENIVAVQDGDTIGVNLADLVARSGSEYKLTEITSIVIGISNQGGNNVMIDDLVFSDVRLETEDAPEEPVMIGFTEDFETEDMVVANKITVDSNAIPTIANDGTNRYLSIAANGPFALEFTGYSLDDCDFTQAKGIKFDFTLNQSATLLIQLGSYGNVYTYERQFYGASNNVDSIVCDFASMTLRSDSYGELNKAAISYIQLYITCYGEYTVTMDNVSFYGEDYVPTSVLLDDFSSYADDAALQSAWNYSALALSDGEMKLTTVSGWNGLQLNLSASDDRQNCYALQMKLTATVDVSLTIKLSCWDSYKETTISVAAGTNVVTVYFCNLTAGATDLYNYGLTSLTVGFTYYGVTDILVDNVCFLRG